MAYAARVGSVSRYPVDLRGSEQSDGTLTDSIALHSSDTPNPLQSGRSRYIGDPLIKVSTCSSVRARGLHPCS